MCIPAPYQRVAGSWAGNSTAADGNSKAEQVLLSSSPDALTVL